MKNAKMAIKTNVSRTQYTSACIERRIERVSAAVAVVTESLSDRAIAGAWEEKEPFFLIFDWP